MAVLYHVVLVELTMIADTGALKGLKGSVV